VAGVSGDQRLHGYDGDTGAVIYAGGGVNELMTGTRQWNTGMAARVGFISVRITKSMRLGCQQERLRLHLLLVQFHSNIYTDRDSYCDGHGTATATPTASVTPTPSEAPCAATGSQPACNSIVFTQLTDFAVTSAALSVLLPPERFHG